MANNGPKFASVNLNKSYGQPHHFPHYNGGGQGIASGRGRSVGGSSGGMVVLSRNRGMAPKVVPKLSIPPPMNLPSLRKEHEKYDMLGSGGSGVGGTNNGGPRPTSSGVGWTKPTVTMTEKNISGIDIPGARAVGTMIDADVASASYIPPSARTGAVGVMTSVSRDIPPSADKAIVLRGEDFPTLQAARPVSSGTSRKQMDLKQKHVENEGLNMGRRGSSDAQQSGLTPMGKGGHQVMENHHDQVSSSRKNWDYLPDPLPLVRMTPRSDWADDERDTGPGFVEHEREAGFQKSENYWDRDFDFPLPSFLPYKPIHRHPERHGKDNEMGSSFPSETRKLDAYKKYSNEVYQEGREVDKWRSSLSRDGSQESGIHGVDVRRRMAAPGNILKENKYVPPHHADTSRDGNNTGKQDSLFGWRDLSIMGRQHPNNSVEFSYNHIRQDKHLSNQNSRFRDDKYQNNAFAKPLVGSVGKMGSMVDPMMNVEKDKRFLRSDNPISDGKPLLRDINSAVFDEKDLFAGGVVGIIKRKKNAAKINDIHDPVRESFEAELERVQRIQELERQRATEEQERAFEQAQREKEKREKRIMEEEEHMRRLEEEAREAAQRAERDHLEAIRRAEEQRIAREEERKRFQQEEDRRKQAAKQKLLEVEARMARREADAFKGDASAPSRSVYEKLDPAAKENYSSRKSDRDSWENGKRMMEDVKTSVSFDSYASNRPEANLKAYTRVEDPSNFHERGKASSSWRKDVTENDGTFSSPFSNLETVHGDSAAALRKESHGETQWIRNRGLLKVGDNESSSDDLGYNKEHRQNLAAKMDSYPKHKFNDSELHDDIAEKYVDNGWGLRKSQTPTYSDHMHPTAEANEFCFTGRARYFLRQPRVLPPPSFAPTQRATSIAAENAGQPAFSDSGIQHSRDSRIDRGGERAYIDHGQQILEMPDAFRLQRDDFTSSGQKLENESGCDSQSSLSVSSPPASPPHLSHDEFEDSYILSSAESERKLLRKNDSLACNNNIIVSDSVCEVGDEEWGPGHDYTLQQQEEYDEDENGHQENDDLRDVNENTEIQNLELTHEEMQLPDIQNNVVLGFDEGVEVEISNDDFENILETQERLIGAAGRSFGFVDESSPVNALSSEERNIMSAVDSHKRISDSSSGLVTETYAWECSGQQISAPCSLTDTSHIDCGNLVDASVFNGKGRVSSSGEVNSGISQTQNISSLAYSETGGDLPQKLQFGLFSGTSTCPLPAIQIGSIKMPLHTHLPVVSPITHMNPSQPPTFQFGKLHHSFPPSQGIFGIPLESIPFDQPNGINHLSLNPDAGVSMTRESGVDASTHRLAKDLMPSISLSDRQGASLKNLDGSHHDNSHVHSSSSLSSRRDDKKFSGTGFLVEAMGKLDAASKDILPSATAGGSDSQLPNAKPVMQSVFVENKFSGMRRFSQLSGGRGRKFIYGMKNGHTSSSKHDYTIPDDTHEIQRRPRRVVQKREYRVRVKDERKAREQSVYSNDIALDDKPTYLEKSSGALTSSGSKRSIKQKIEISSAGSVVSGNLNSGDRAVKETQMYSSKKTQNASQFGGVNLRQAASEDVDAPMQSGVVRVFKQPGIECPSDEDDFIEVRSKRQMLNDRREQREKETKAKSLTTKPVRKSQPSRQKDGVPKSQGKVPAHLSGYTTQVILPARASAASQPPTAKCQENSETQSIKASHLSPVRIFSSDGSEHDHAQMPDTRNTVISMGHDQMDEATKPARHSSPVSSVGGHPTAVGDALVDFPVPSIAEDKTFSGANSISLGIRENIQFGAVMSPVVLPPSSDAMSHGIGAPGLSQGNINISQPFQVAVKQSSLHYEKDKHLSGSHAPKQDSEAEAASAIAAAAASSYKMVKDDLVPDNDTKEFGSPNISHTRTGVVGDKKSPSHLRADEYSVSLPEDLSVETTTISIWPPLPSPQSSPSQIVSHFTPGPHTHYPFYEVNPILGGPFFAPSQESSGAQLQIQNSTASGSGPLGNWQQHHSNVDSFYGRPAAYSGPFVSPPGSIPGVQGAPMVVYNHFPPVGQYGQQVGVGLMGAATYIPPGKQADWKKSSTSLGEGDVKDVNVSNMQRNPPTMAPPFQHLAPGSPLLPVLSAVPVFDKSPFQTVPDLTMQPSLGPLHSAPVSRPIQTQDEVALHSQVKHGLSVEQPVTTHRLAESRVASTSDTNANFVVVKNANVGGVVDESLAASAAPSVQNSSIHGSSASADAESVKINKKENVKKQTVGSVKTQQYAQRNAPPQHGQTPSGYNVQRGGMTQVNNQGHEWPRPRISFRGRNQPFGGDRGFPAVKSRQIYVAKQTPNLSSST